MTDSDTIKQQARDAVAAWVKSCTRGKKISRNTIAMGIVVLDHLHRASPVAREAVISPGGEVTNSRSGLGRVLETYGLPGRSFLKEATTRQVHQDGQRLFENLEWGADIARLPNGERQALLLELIGGFVDNATSWLNRQNIELSIDRRQAPVTWVNSLMERARGKSGGIVEQHLVGAKLARRFPGIVITNHPAHAADVQTDRLGDFEIRDTVYHVTARVSEDVIEKCAANVRANKRPVLLVPRRIEELISGVAVSKGVYENISIISIEDFLAVNIIELAAGDNSDFFDVLGEIIDIYNERLREVETDLSLQIEVK